MSFTETGYDKHGYEVFVTGSGTTENLTIAEATADETPGVARFVNTYREKGVVLPLTGGPGTTWFRIIGLLILASAAGLYAYRRRLRLKTILAARKGNASTSQRGGGGLL